MPLIFMPPLDGFPGFAGAFFVTGSSTWCFLGSQLVRHHVGRNLAVPDGRQQVVQGILRHLVGDLYEFVGLEDLGRAQFVLAEVLFQQFLAEQDAAAALFCLEPCLDPGPGLRGLDELEPVPAGRMARLGDRPRSCPRSGGHA